MLCNMLYSIMDMLACCRPCMGLLPVGHCRLTAAASGVTGSRAKIEDRVQGLIEFLHSVSDKPVAVGFGVSTPEQVCV